MKAKNAPNPHLKPERQMMRYRSIFSQSLRQATPVSHLDVLVQQPSDVVETHGHASLPHAYAPTTIHPIITPTNIGYHVIIVKNPTQ